MESVMSSWKKPPNGFF